MGLPVACNIGDVLPVWSFSTLPFLQVSFRCDFRIELHLDWKAASSSLEWMDKYQVEEENEQEASFCSEQKAALLLCVVAKVGLSEDACNTTCK